MPQKYSDAYIARVASGQEQASNAYVRRLANAYKAGKVQPGGSRKAARGHAAYESRKPARPKPEYSEDLLEQLLIQYFKQTQSVSKSIRSQLEQRRTSLDTIQDKIGVDRIANSSVIFPGAIYTFEDRIIARGFDNDPYYLTEIISTRTGRTIYQWMLLDDIRGVYSNNITQVSDRTIADVVIYFAAF